MDKNNQISVIVVTFNSKRTIKECINSIIKYSPNVEIIVVDNQSLDETCQIIEQFKQLKLIKTGENLGFAKANNIGVKESSGRYLVFLNPDAMLTAPESLNYLQKILEKNLEYGILGPKLIYPDGQVQERVRNLPTVFGAFKEYILGINGAYGFYQPKCQTLCEVESVIGACMMIQKNIFEKVGGFDERYFLYYEDLELCKKIRSLGLKVGFVPEVVVEHAEGISGKNQKTNDLMEMSAKEYFGLFSYFLLKLIFLYNRIMNRVRKTAGRPVRI